MPPSRTSLLVKESKEAVVALCNQYCGALKNIAEVSNGTQYDYEFAHHEFVTIVVSPTACICVSSCYGMLYDLTIKGFESHMERWFKFGVIGDTHLKLIESHCDYPYRILVKYLIGWVVGKKYQYSLGLHYLSGLCLLLNTTYGTETYRIKSSNDKMLFYCGNVEYRQTIQEVKKHLLETCVTIPSKESLVIEAPVATKLHALANLFNERNGVYGDAPGDTARIMEVLLPVLPENPSVHDRKRLYLLEMVVCKLARYGNNFMSGGHEDSLDDLAVYATMLNEEDKQCVST